MDNVWVTHKMVSARVMHHYLVWNCKMLLTLLLRLHVFITQMFILKLIVRAMNRFGFLNICYDLQLL